ncbi:MAG: protein kinase domain-containing protein [Thermoanaerobaculia bacterium]
MILTAGSRVGPYQIVAALGAGGMGEVYRARDPRIGREVAVKVLPPAFAADADRVRRFEQEARAAGALNHPGLLTIFDVGTHDDLLYIVSELLDGTTLREQLTRPLSTRRAVDTTLQIARALVVAHDKGIIHRDLKPENIFITADDRVKLLDFGLAKVVSDERLSPDAPTAKHERPDTGAGVLLGTVSYMSPEQVRGQAIDHRTDVFALGIVLYEMLSGSRPFRGPSSVETMASILNDDPPSLVPAAGNALQRIVQHALQKSPSQRFQSMTDVVFALETFSSGGDTPAPSRTRAKREVKAAPTPADVRFRRVTFRRGFVMTARFAPDGSIMYGASWEDQPNEIFAAVPNNPESRPVGLGNADVLAVAPNGELAISLERHFVGGWVTSGTLARIPSFGGAPRELAADVQDADWTPDGGALAVIRMDGERFVIEMPLGNRIYESPEWISNVRISPKGDRVAFLQHERWGDDSGRVMVIGARGERLVESSGYHSIAGTAWTPNGDEIWTSAHHEGTGRDIVALSMRGRERIVLPTPGRFTLNDIAADGRVLVAMESGSREMMLGTRNDGPERNLTWLDWSFLGGISPDGSRVVFEEQVGARRNNANAVYVRKSDGSPAVRFGEGTARSFSPDGRMIGVIPPGNDALHLLPIGVGTPKVVPLRGLTSCVWWEWTADATRLVIWAHHGETGSRHYVLPIDGDDPPRPVTPAGCGWWFAVSPDSTHIVAAMPDREPMRYPLAGGDPLPIDGAQRGDLPIQWSADGGSIYVFRPSRFTVGIDRIDLTTGARSRWHDLRPADATGIMDIQPIFMTRDGAHYAYAYRRFISDLYIVEGLL